MNRGKYTGIILGGLYGLLYRVLCEKNDDIIYELSIFSISFIWVLPIVIALIPIWFSREQIKSSRLKQFFFPIASVLLFFIIALATHLEDLLCILILSLPFILVAGLSGILFTELIKRRESNKLLSLIALPFLLVPFEEHFPDRYQDYELEKSILINASPEEVWDSIIEVPEIGKEEYDEGFFNFIGIPRPLRSELLQLDGKEYRLGYFSDDLRLYEEITQRDSAHFVAFKINLEKSILRDLPTDKHILESDYFKFDTISYTLEKRGSNRTELILSCSYSLKSKMNWYASFWANQIIEDFELKLLKVLRKKIEAPNA